MDGNVVHWGEQEIVDFVVANKIDLVGMGFMTRMAQKAYRVAAAIRKQTGIPVVFGGPHVTALPLEPLGLSGHPQVADAVVVGEADNIWPKVVEDAASGHLDSIYRIPQVEGHDVKPALSSYPIIRWDDIDLQLFNLMRCVPAPVRKLLKTISVPFEKAYVIPVESGRGCPYGCEFCTVTGFFGDEIRFRSNESVIEELLLLKSLAARDKALVMVFFIDDNLAINRKRIKSLLRDMIANDVCLPWVGQISINLLRDEELVELIAESGGRWIFAGLESMEPDSLKAAGKQFNKPVDYQQTLDLLARHNVYAITSFIVGLEGDRPGMSGRISSELANWPPGLPVFGLLTPYPATPLYDRLKGEGRLTRPEHWLDFRAFQTAFVPKHLSGTEAESEIRASWSAAYGPAAFRRTQKWMLSKGKPFAQQLTLFIARLLFRGIYFPQMTGWSWVKLMISNLPTTLSLVRSGLRVRWGSRKADSDSGSVFPHGSDGVVEAWDESPRSE